MSESGADNSGKTYAPLAEVAAAYGVSVDTIRRRLKRGELDGRRETTPQGFRWLAAMPDVPGSLQIGDRADHDSDIVIAQRDRDLIEMLQHELEVRNQEIARLHDVATTQARAIERVTAAMPVLPESTTPAEASSEGQEAGAPVVQRLETLWQRVRRLFRARLVDARDAVRRRTR